MGKPVTLCNTTASCYDAGASWWGVGAGAAITLGASATSIQGLGLEGFVVQAAGTHGSVAISGGEDSHRGTLYGVNHVLRSLGMEFYAHDVTQLPSSLPAVAPDGMLAKVIPALEYREQYEYQCLTQAADERFSKFEAHLGLNRGSPPLSSDPVFGGIVDYGPPGFVHTSCTLLKG